MNQIDQLFEEVRKKYPFLAKGRVVVERWKDLEKVMAEIQKLKLRENLLKTISKDLIERMEALRYEKIRWEMVVEKLEEEKKRLDNLIEEMDNYLTFLRKERKKLAVKNDNLEKKILLAQRILSNLEGIQETILSKPTLLSQRDLVRQMVEEIKDMVEIELPVKEKGGFEEEKKEEETEEHGG